VDDIGVIVLVIIIALCFLAAIISGSGKKAPNTKSALPIPDNCTRVNINSFVEKYGPFIPDQLFNDLLGIKSNGGIYADILNSLLKEIQASYDKECELQNKRVMDVLSPAIGKLNDLEEKFDAEDDPILLRGIQSDMEALINLCIELKEANPYSISGLKDAEQLLENLKEQYNERLFSIVRKSLEQYKLKMIESASKGDNDSETVKMFEQIEESKGLLDYTAENYNESLTAFSGFHDDAESLYSSFMHNDLELSKAFSIISEKTTFKKHIADIVDLICDDKLDKENISKALRVYHLGVADIKLDLLDLLLSYVNFILNKHIITEKEDLNIKVLRGRFNIKEGDFYKYRRNEIKSICQKHFARLSRNDMDRSDELFWVGIQSAFDLSYYRLEKLKNTK
jgi:hypothetical protein